MTKKAKKLNLLIFNNAYRTILKMLKNTKRISFLGFSQEECEYSDDDIKNRNNFILEVLYLLLLIAVVTFLIYLIFSVESVGIIIALTNSLTGIVVSAGTRFYSKR